MGRCSPSFETGYIRSEVIAPLLRGLVSRHAAAASGRRMPAGRRCVMF